MKKITINYTTSATDVVGALDEKMNAMSAEDQVSVVKTMRGLQLNGDLWLRHYHLEPGVLTMYYILDSDQAVENFAPAKAIYEAASGFQDLTVEEMPFEEFAAFAAEHDNDETPRSTKTVELVEAFLAQQAAKEG